VFKICRHALVGAAKEVVGVVEIEKRAFGRWGRDVRSARTLFEAARVVVGEFEGLLLEGGLDLVDHVSVNVGLQVVGVENGG
jgi:hypothetical protein